MDQIVKMLLGSGEQPREITRVYLDTCSYGHPDLVFVSSVFGPAGERVDDTRTEITLLGSARCPACAARETSSAILEDARRLAVGLSAQVERHRGELMAAGRELEVAGDRLAAELLKASSHGAALEVVGDRLEAAGQEIADQVRQAATRVDDLEADRERDELLARRKGNGEESG